MNMKPTSRIWSGWYSKIIAGTVAAYLLSPIQIIPSFIPVIGLMDDVLVLAFEVALIRRFTPDFVVGKVGGEARSGLPGVRTFGPVARAKSPLLTRIGKTPFDNCTPKAPGKLFTRNRTTQDEFRFCTRVHLRSR